MSQKVERLVLKGRRAPVFPVLKKWPRRFLSLTRITVGESSDLFKAVEAHMLRERGRTSTRRNRTRKLGAGRTHEFCLQDRFLMALMRIQGGTEENVSAIFNAPYGLVRAALDEILPVLKMCLETPRFLKWRVTHLRKDQNITDYMEPSKGALDAVVFPTTRPPEKEVRKAFSRGGKGVGLNVQTTVDANGKVIDATRSMPASIHDARVYKITRNGRLLRIFAVLLTDKGYFNVEKSGSIHLVHGDKKPRGGELSDRSRRKNAYINSQKYRVEQTNSHIKNFKILENIHWFEADKLDLLIQVICGLINYRIEHRKKNPVDWGHKNRVRPKRARKPRNMTL